mmetsp:Transcript_10230/g.20862  ORF Transcript_10230/g.20862 Transcript_10230/m.20862 type:complete len:270 (-) Transcript_10230:480-1289(-)|eukprot:CAMPEP_0174720762 /NCGR_PEP_ID=MMETSP1094-20130205/34406_1 /TAXON_ID=156173 /ORGANISM="Chrysochromulina brevifilum, Strain UTEX LB 985" /LENGTH=269 /DNA_ID=CAMNT_0015921303 /DNA_START=37 /DNA_END=846 /DNA_ORIENTATION=-
MPLSDFENCAVGVFCGVSDTTLLQSTNYWKNAQQQGLPFTLDPRVLYRGYGINTLNNGLCVMSQFFLNGQIKNILTGGVDREMTSSEKIGAGVSSGVISSIIASPMELIMIQQQLHGKGMVATAVELIMQGPGTVFRGLLGMCLREGIYCGGYLGVMPVVRAEIGARNPDLSDDTTRLAAACVTTPFVSFASHPADTMKTCLQGDVAGAKYSGYAQTAKSLIAERGIQSLWAGLPWRLFRQGCAIFLFDKINAELVPMIFPHAFKKEKR